MDKLTVKTYPAAKEAPILYCILDVQEGQALAARLDGACSLAAVSGADWNHDLAPWPAKAVFRGGEDFGGGAEETLSRLISMLPEAERGLNPAQRYLMGYSLAGLFAAWSAARTDAFDGIASVSGSMWYPGFAAFMEKEDPIVRKAYFSVGEKERMARNPVFHTIEQDTLRVQSRFAARGAETIFERNPGGHFQDPLGRLERAARWLIQLSTGEIEVRG